MASLLLDLLLPQRCVACGLSGAQVCGACLGSLPRLRGPRCERCCAPTAWPVRRCRECAGRRLAFARARSAVAYDESVRRLVHAWKDRGLRGLAAAAAAVTADTIEHCGEPLVFVPPDPDRRRTRGHHPAEVLARELGARWNAPVLALLARASGGERQRGLTIEERRANVRGAFSAARSPPAVVLVDDVYTTGATANAAASALRRAGARRIEVVTFARAVRGYTVTTQV
jgi:predicted amidophosphoribosyltransferase